MNLYILAIQPIDVITLLIQETFTEKKKSIPVTLEPIFLYFHNAVLTLAEVNSNSPYAVIALWRHTIILMVVVD